MIAVGTDLVEIERFRSVLSRRPGIVERLFTDAEREAVGRRLDPVPSYAARFAAKEAVMKALGAGLGAVRFAEVEIGRADSGAPSVELSGRAADLATRRGLARFAVSLTHTAATAGAVVVAQ